MVARQRQLQARSHDDLAVDRDRLLLRRADREDRCLRRIQHRDEALDPEHAEVRDRERSALEVRLLQLAGARTLHHSGPVGRDLGDRLVLAVANHRDDEAVRYRHRDADVRGRVELDRLAFVQRVDPAVPHQRGGADLRQQIGDGWLDAVAVQVDEPFTHLERAAHVDRDPELENRCLPRLGQAARDRLAHRRQLLDLDLHRARRGSGHRRRGRSLRRRTLHVLGDHTALGPGPGDRAQIDAALARDPARQRRGLDAAAPGGRGLELGHLLSVAVGRRLPPPLAILFTRARGRALLLRVVAHLDRLALLADHSDRLTDRHLTFRDRDPEEDTRGVGLDLLRHLVGIELVEGLALLDLVALGLEPLDDGAGLHPLAETRQLDLSRHRALASCGSQRARRWRAVRPTPPSRARTAAA